MKRKLEICVLALVLVPGLALAGSPTPILRSRRRHRFKRT